ncbi:hypothetical protein [Halobacterium hubeiense]|uniref:hypothetical protein n=1 Tax=Halobacterium hubeiense TaxID=1407499 RepID=UPI003C74AD47
MSETTDSDGCTAAIDRKNAVDATISADKLETFLERIHALVEEARVHFDGDGVHCYAVDPANVGYVESHIDEVVFGEYKAVDCVIGAPIRKLRTVLEVMDGDVEIAVNVAEETVSFDDGDAQYQTEYVDPDSVRQADHDRDWETAAEVYVGGHELKRAAKLASEVGDHIELDYDPDTKTLQAIADEDVQSSAVDISTTATPQNNDAWGYYSEDYFTDMLDAIPPAASIAVGLGEDNVPLELGVSHGQIQTDYALAPRITGVDD